MHVILDIFSGRPNPTWELSQQQADEFLKKIYYLKPTKIFHDDNGLGYRGFVVEDKLKRYEVNNGLVKIVENNSEQMLQDKDYILEVWLAHTAPNNIDHNLLKIVEENIKERKKNPDK